jgi:hypothetical protein
MDNHDTEKAVPLDFVARAGVTPEVLRLALRFGERAAIRFAPTPFEQIESELQVAWGRRGEGTGWHWVRAAVRAGYEQDADDT